jgi:hypothetical protein
MSTYSLTLRSEGQKLSIQELDNNFRYLEDLALTGSSLPTNPGNLMNISEGEVISSPINRIFVLGKTLFENPLIHTGTVSETIIFTQSVPANTFRVGDIIQNKTIDASFILENSGTMTFSVYWNTEPTLQGSELLSQVSSSGENGASPSSYNESFSLVDIDSKVVVVYDTNVVISVDDNQIPPIYDEYTIWNLDEEVYLILTVQLEDPGDRLCLWSSYIENSAITPNY